MRRLLTAFALVSVFAVLALGQEKPANWNTMSADQQAAWLAGSKGATTKASASSVPPVSASSFPKSAPALAVCGDGQRFALPIFELSGLTTEEVSQINRNNAATNCAGHGYVLKVLWVGATEVADTQAVRTPSAVSTIPPTLATATKPASTTTASTSRSSPDCAENGTCYGDTSATTGKPKTTYVSGFTRKDGTYVRGHYRSK